jgi:hypothetical protein
MIARTLSCASQEIAYDIHGLVKKVRWMKISR